MFLERFSDWYFTQPEMIQRVVLTVRPCWCRRSSASRWADG
ncbi:hypothetical protein [Brevundimonas sp.]